MTDEIGQPGGQDQGRGGKPWPGVSGTNGKAEPTPRGLGASGPVPAVASGTADPKRAQTEREITIDLLRMLNSDNTLHDLLRDVAMLMQSWTGCEAVGIRLRAGDDFPYFETWGFATEFVQIENSLCARDQAGELVRDSQGNPVIECMCGNVICGRFDPELPFFTEGGSFWSNGTTALLASTSEQDRQARTRNRCNGEGYESVALIPLRPGGRPMGLLQFNDRRKNMFTLQSIQQFERLAASLAIGLTQRQAAHAMKESESTLHATLEAVTESVFLMDARGVIQVANATGAARLGLWPEDIIGRCAYDLLPPELVASRRTAVEAVIRTGQPQRFQDQRDGRWIDQTIYPVRGADGRADRVVVYARDVTESKWVEDALRQSEAMNRSVLNAIGASIAVVDRRGVITAVNRSWQEFARANGDLSNGDATGVGCNYLEVTRRAAGDSIEGAAEAADGIQAVLSGHRGEFALEYPCHSPDQQRWFMLVATPLGDGGAVLAHVNSTERKQAEELRRGSEERYRLLFETMLDGFALHEIVCDPAGRPVDYRFLDVNPAFERLTGLRARDIVGRSVREVLPGIEESWIDTYGKVALTGEPASFESFNGDLGRWFRIFAYRPAPGQFACLFEDITERKLAEEAVRQSEEHNRALVENIRLGISLIGPDHRILATNAAQAELSRRSAGEMVGQRCFQAFRGKDQVCSDCPGVAAMGSEPPAEHVHEGVRGDGTTFVARVRAFPLLGQDGRPRGFIEVVEDITQQRQLEAQYRQAQKMEAIGRLAAGVAHDFNNQLTVIQGYCEMLIAGRRPDDTLWEALTQIREAGKRAQSTTSHLLSFSRQQILQPQVVNPRETLEEMRMPVSRMVGEDIRLVVAAAPGVPSVFVDKSGMQQAIMNLVVNARDAMPNGGELVLRTSTAMLGPQEASEYPGGKAGFWVLLEVIDSGVGMDAQTLERVYDPFFTTKEVGKGTGLGVPMVHGFIGQSNGFMGFRSQAGKGTTVRLFLPPAEGVTPKGEPAPAPSQSARQSAATVLVVEDEQEVRRFLVTALRLRGCHVLEAPGPEQALELSSRYEGKVDLLLTDVVMPGMDGYELADRLKAKRKALRTVFLTGYSDKPPRKGVKVLHKPFSMDDLNAFLDESLGPRRCREGK